MLVSKIYQQPVDFYDCVQTFIVGVVFQCPDDWESVLDSLNKNSNLYLKKEPDNIKDELAIAIFLDNRRIGYVSGEDNRKIWLFMTDEKLKCNFLERINKGFKISFKNPRSEFEGMPFEEIYRDNEGYSKRPRVSFDIPFLTDSKDENYKWIEDKTFVNDLEWLIPDFRRKLAARKIILVGMKNIRGEYHYYLPYNHTRISSIDDIYVQSAIDKYGFVIALPDVPMKSKEGYIIMDLHVTYLPKSKFKTFNKKHSDFVFHLIENDLTINQKNKTTKIENENGEYYKLENTKTGGKKVSMGVIVPEEGDPDFEFCTYTIHITKDEHKQLISDYLQRYKRGEETKSFLMIGRPCLGLEGLYSFYSLDGNEIYDFIFDKKLQRWINEAGFVLGKLKIKDYDFTHFFEIELTVSKRKKGEDLFKQASKEAMNYLYDDTESIAKRKIESKIIKAVKSYKTGKTNKPYQILVIPKGNFAFYYTIDGDEIAVVMDFEILSLAQENNSIYGYIIDYKYDEDSDKVNFTIRVSQSIPKYWK